RVVNGRRFRLCSKPVGLGASYTTRRKNDMTGQAPLRKPVCFLTGFLTLAAVVTACVLMPVARAQVGPPDYSAIIAAPDRTDADLQTDKRRDPVKLLAFTAVRPGMKVLDMGAGGGYS